MMGQNRIVCENRSTPYLSYKFCTYAVLQNPLPAPLRIVTVGADVLKNYFDNPEKARFIFRTWVDRQCQWRGTAYFFKKHIRVECWRARAELRDLNSQIGDAAGPPPIAGWPPRRCGCQDSRRRDAPGRLAAQPIGIGKAADHSTGARRGNGRGQRRRRSRRCCRRRPAVAPTVASRRSL